MADELKHIEILYGRNRMAVLSCPTADADAAIAAGWAWDLAVVPIAPEPVTDEERAALIEAADAEVDKWRAPPEPPPEPLPEEGGTYRTRDEHAAKRGPGRPPKDK